MNQLVSRASAGRLLLFSVCASLLYLAGCGGDDYEAPPTAQVTGTVTVDGKPLTKQGLTLVFNPIQTAPAEEGGAATTGASTGFVEIQPDGTFSGEVPVGKHRVHVVVTGGGVDHFNPNAATQAFGVNPAYLENPNVENSAPRKFHEVTVKEGGLNEYTFEFGK